MPVSVTFRKALVGHGMVAQLHNNSGALLRLNVTISSKSSGKSKQFEFVAPVGQKMEIGVLEGWDLIPGDEMTITHPDYSAYRCSAPQMR